MVVVGRDEIEATSILHYEQKRELLAKIDAFPELEDLTSDYQFCSAYLDLADLSQDYYDADFEAQGEEFYPFRVIGSRRYMIAADLAQTFREIGLKAEEDKIAAIEAIIEANGGFVNIRAELEEAYAATKLPQAERYPDLFDPNHQILSSFCGEQQ